VRGLPLKRSRPTFTCPIFPERKPTHEPIARLQPHRLVTKFFTQSHLLARLGFSSSPLDRRAGVCSQGGTRDAKQHDAEAGRADQEQCSQASKSQQHICITFAVAARQACTHHTTSFVASDDCGLSPDCRSLVPQPTAVA
jgi:hypothetical protein